jgi:ferredoxin
VEKMAVVTVDASLCTGCGLCVNSCPEVFEIGDDNIAHVKASSCSDHNVNEVAADCPVSAINVSE